MDQRNDEDKNNDVRKRFAEYVEKYNLYKQKLSEVLTQTLQEFLVLQLTTYLKTLTNKGKTTFIMTVQLIKNWALTVESNDPTIKTLQDTHVKEFPKKTLSEVAQLG